MRSISLFFRFSPVRLIALLLLALPVFVSAQSAPVPEVEQRIRVIKGLQLRLDKLLPMAGKEMSAQQEAVEPFLRESYKRPGEMASGPDADRWYRSALKLNRIADDMIAGGKGDTGLNPWKQFTPEDLVQRLMTTHDFCETRQKCLPEEMSDIEKMMRWMQKDVENGNMTLPDFVDMACQMIDRFEQVVIKPLPAERFFDLYELPDRKQARMLQVRTEKLMQLTFQKRAFLNAAKQPIEAVNALVDAMQKSEKSPGLEKALEIAVRRLIVIADDILAGGDGTTGRKPWKQFTPEDLSELVKRMDPVAAGQQAGFSAVDTNFRKMALQVNAGELSVGDFIDGMCLTIGKLIAKQKPPLTSPAKSSRK